MKKKLFSLLLVLPLVSPVFSQEEEAVVDTNRIERLPNTPAHDAVNFTGIDYAAYKKEHIASKKYIPYVHVREADVLWQKTVWRFIDLRERANFPLYYPVDPIDGRRSLVQVIYDAIEKGDLVPYTADITTDEFKSRLAFTEVQKNLGGGTVPIFDEENDPEHNNGPIGTAIEGIKPDQIKRFLLKEVWFFDRKYSRMDVRILAICPIRQYYDESKQPQQTLCFWIYFPELRPFLSEQEVFNARNDAQRMSLDDIFAQRRFSSYIMREANIYNNRQIRDYAQTLEANLESRRIQNVIFEKEHDMWEY